MDLFSYVGGLVELDKPTWVLGKLVLMYLMVLVAQHGLEGARPCLGILCLLQDI